LLNRADLLITGDTSIKHLAASTACKVVELCLGSSDWRRTGIFKDDSLIIAGRTACAPCSHSSACTQTAHLCAVPVTAEVVSSAVKLFMGGDWNRLQDMASGQSEVYMLRARRLTLGFWYAQDLGDTDPSRMAADLLKRVAWKLAFNRGRGDRSVEFGSAGMALRHELRALSGQDFALGHFEFLENAEISESAELSRNLIDLRRQSLSSAAGRLAEIGDLRRRQIELESKMEHSEFKTKLLRTLRLHWMEKI
jgi:hypothetical protein